MLRKRQQAPNTEEANWEAQKTLAGTNSTRTSFSVTRLSVSDGIGSFFGPCWLTVGIFLARNEHTVSFRRKRDILDSRPDAR